MFSMPPPASMTSTVEEVPRGVVRRVHEYDLLLGGDVERDSAEGRDLAFGPYQDGRWLLRYWQEGRVLPLRRRTRHGLAWWRARIPAARPPGGGQ